MRVLAIAALVLLTGCAANNSRGGVPTGIAPKIRPIENGKPVPRETSFNNRFGRWRKVTVDVWIPNKEK